MVENHSKKGVSILTIIGICILVPLMSFVIINTVLNWYVRNCERRLKPTQDRLPQELQSLGLKLDVEPYGKETKLLTFSYKDSTEQWARNYDTLNAIGPTFVAADIDADALPELIMFQGWLVSSDLITSACPPALNFSAIYDMVNNELSVSCTPPTFCSFYISEQYTGLFPGIGGTIVLISLGLAFLLSTLCLIGYLSYRGYQWYHNKKKSE